MTETAVLRVERPYLTEAEFLLAEGWTITKRNAYLIGVPAYPEGAIVRCELLLTSGVRLLVAEAAVARYVHETAERPAGLVVRYRRMTPASSQFVDRALKVRETAAEPSSPSTVQNQRTPDMPTSREALVGPISQSPALGSQKSHARTASDTSEALSRLSGRLVSASIEPPLDRGSVLSRLRARANNVDC